MINLLPDETKQQIQAARTNSSLIKLVVFLGFAVIFLALACTVSYFFLLNNKNDAEKLIARNQSTSNPNSSVTSQANAIVANLATTKSILDQQILYSTIITGLGAVMPAGIVLDNLSLSSTSIGTPITLKMRARTNDAVTTLKANFQKSSLFSNYNLQALSTNNNDTTGYPIQFSVGITINKSVAQ